MTKRGSCSICEHQRCPEINRAIKAGLDRAAIQREFSVGTRTLRRHAMVCLGIKSSPRWTVRCVICRAGPVNEVSLRILDGATTGDIVREFGLHDEAVRRHASICMGITLPKRQHPVKGSCIVCDDTRVGAINDMLETNGVSIAEVVRLFGFCHHTISRHRTIHMGLPPRKGVVGCPICKHSLILEINRALEKGEVFAVIAARYRVPVRTLQRHKSRHLKVLVKDEREAVMAEVLGAELSQRRASGRLRQFMARPEVEAGLEATQMIGSVRPVLERRIREAERLMIMGEAIAKQGRDARAAGEAALQDLERADTELARRKIAREITDRQRLA